MPGPFPGMDPYLEDPGEWPGVHQRLITYTADTLTAVLPPEYAAVMGERLLVLPSERNLAPRAGPSGMRRDGT